MKVRLLGTGSSDGWPNPWCTCASCEWARTNELRGHTSVLVDDCLLLDCGPDVPRSASRLGLHLGDVRWLLLGHAHADHTGAEALMWRGWSSRTKAPLDVAGPPAAIAKCRGRLPARTPVHLQEVAPGDEIECGPYRARAWRARHGGPRVGPAVLWDVTGPDGSRLLYATDTAPLSEAELPTGPYDLVLLEETYGDAAPFGDHLGLDTFADTVAALRRSGAVHETTRIVAIHLGHGNPPGPELARRLAAFGAEVHPDGAELTIGVGPVVARRALPRRVLITGGARSGKSEEAERRLRGEPDVVYVATAPEMPDDQEWTARVQRHRERRPGHWDLVETGKVAPLLGCPGPPLLVDDLGLWLTRGEEDEEELVSAYRDTARPVVLVTSEVGSGVVPGTAAGREFRDRLGALTVRLARESDEVWHCVAGVPTRVR